MVKTQAQRMLILEVNEVPPRVFRYFAKQRPQSALATMLKSSHFVTSLADDVDKSFLYPSQTWASLNTGVAYDQHKIHWYNDPKPDEYPLYWKTIADAGRSVGIVNSLHSSPGEAVAAKHPNITFLIPDCFASDAYTKPSSFEPFQGLNIMAVSGNSRTASMSLPIKEAVGTVLRAPSYGITSSTLFHTALTVAQIGMGKRNRENLRNLQFPLVADIFLKQMKRADPDLAILFTNHVAANLHRYWYALFPEDYSEVIYDQDWVARYSGEIMSALELLDRYIDRLKRFCDETDRTLVIVSSMGQEANPKLTRAYRVSHSVDFRLQDVRKFVDAVTETRHSYSVETAMVPQYQLRFATASAAAPCAKQLKDAITHLKGYSLVVDSNDEVITISVAPDPAAPAYEFKGAPLPPENVGFLKFDVDDHHSGHHCEDGTLIVYNSRTFKNNGDSVSYLEFAPAVLQRFGIAPLPHHRQPSLVL